MVTAYFFENTLLMYRDKDTIKIVHKNFKPHDIVFLEENLGIDGIQKIEIDNDELCLYLVGGTE